MVIAVAAVLVAVGTAAWYVENSFGRVSEKISGTAKEIRKEMNKNTSDLTDKIHQNANRLEGLKATVSNMKDDVTRMDKKIDRLQEQKKASIGLFD